MLNYRKILIGWKKKVDGNLKRNIENLGQK
jgi:hypothetical protein